MFQTYHISMISTWIYSKEIYLKSNFDDPINSKSIYEVTITSRNLTKLIINGRNDAEFLIMKAVKFCSKLHHLELRNCRGLQCLLGLSDACLTTIGTFPSHIFYLLFKSKFSEKTQLPFIWWDSYKNFTFICNIG